MKRFASASALAILLVLACDEPVSLPPVGSISIRFASSDEAAASLSADPEEPPPGDLDRPAKKPPEETDIPEVVRAAQAPAEPQAHFSEYHIRLQGPSLKDTTVSAGATSVTLGNLNVGSYSVIVEGLVNDSVDYYGRADGVQVAAGQTANADLTSSFKSVRPTLANFSADTTKTRVLVQYTRVTVATGYRIEWDDAPTFSSPDIVTPPGTDTSAYINVTAAGTYHVRVFAVTSVSGVRPSDTKSFRVAADQAPAVPAAAPPPAVRLRSHHRHAVWVQRLSGRGRGLVCAQRVPGGHAGPRDRGRAAARVFRPQHQAPAVPVQRHHASSHERQH